MSIPGLHYHDNQLPQQEIQDLLTQIESNEWDTSLSRRTQHYGYRYLYNNKSNKDQQALPYDGDIEKLGDKLGTMFGTTFNSCIVNEYVKGSSISPHIDDKKKFGGKICSVSLLDSCYMIFSRPGKVIMKKLEQGSFLLMENEARYNWYHSIPARSTSKEGFRRISITYRRVL